MIGPHVRADADDVRGDPRSKRRFGGVHRLDASTDLVVSVLAGVGLSVGGEDEDGGVSGLRGRHQGVEHPEHRRHAVTSGRAARRVLHAVAHVDGVVVVDGAGHGAEVRARATGTALVAHEAEADARLKREEQAIGGVEQRVAERVPAAGARAGRKVLAAHAARAIDDEQHVGGDPFGVEVDRRAGVVRGLRVARSDLTHHAIAGAAVGRRHAAPIGLTAKATGAHHGARAVRVAAARLVAVEARGAGVGRGAARAAGDGRRRHVAHPIAGGPSAVAAEGAEDQGKGEEKRCGPAVRHGHLPCRKDDRCGSRTANGIATAPCSATARRPTETSRIRTRRPRTGSAPRGWLLPEARRRPCR